MKTVEISYDPYRMKTKMSINGIDVCTNRSYDKIRRFIEAGVPLQTWIEPVEYQGWKGLVNEVSHPENNDEVTLVFSGREIDFQDLKRFIETQNSQRAEDNQVRYEYQQKKVLNDEEISECIDKVVQELKSERFKSLVAQRSKKTDLWDKYNNLEKNYALAKEDVFYIVFAGTYSSGKSTLLNALMRHNILPTQQGTCTSKNCRIRHVPSLDGKVSLACFDAQNKLIGEKMIFNSDADCSSAFQEKTNKPDVATMELGVDLSHLYPERVNKDKFNIVLIDTPGMDSAKSSKDGSNLHAQIALDAITMRNKPIIVFCADAGYADNKSIGEFMREFLARSPEEYRGFTDRFLFLLNKSDTIKYTKNQTAWDVKREFAEYLTDSSKWNIKGDEEELRELAERASHFVPRVFMTAAGVEAAIQQGAPDFTSEDLEDTDKENLSDLYEDFAKRVWDRKKENFYLSRYCDIPNYRRAELEERFQETREEEDRVLAVQIQCGIMPVEISIRDYIERYAYPIKVHDLLDTFEDILHDVKSFSGGILEEMKQIKSKLGESSRQRKEATESKGGVEEKRDAFEKAKKEIDEKLDELNLIVFDSDALNRTRTELTASIEENKDVIFIRSNQPKVYTGTRSRAEVEKEVKRRISNIQAAFDGALQEANRELEKIKEGNDEQLRTIYASIEGAIEVLKRNDLFDQGEYNFTDSVTWKRNFENINFEDYTSDVLKSVVDTRAREVWTFNRRKSEWQGSKSPFKKFFSLFMPETVKDIRYDDGSYETVEIVKSLSSYYRNLEKQISEMKEAFKTILEADKEKAKALIKKLVSHIEYFRNDIQKQQERIDSLSGDIDALNEEIGKSQETYDWLNKLQEDIQGV